MRKPRKNRLKVIVLGLSYDNLDRLRAGHPIKFDGSTAGFNKVEFLVFAGETKRSVQRDLWSAIELLATK
jgi:hypothetical protein